MQNFLLWSFFSLFLWIGCTPESNGLHPDPEPFLLEPEALPVEVPFRVWMKSHFHHSDPFRFWIETKNPVFLQFQVFPCPEGPFSATLAPQVLQQQQFFSSGRQAVSLNPTFPEGIYLLKIMNWDWLCYVPFSYSSAKPSWYPPATPAGKTHIIFYPEPPNTTILFKNQEADQPHLLTSGSLLTTQPVYLPSLHCYLDLGHWPPLPTQIPTSPKALDSTATLWQLSQPGIRYQHLITPQTNSTEEATLIGTLDTFFLDHPGSVKLKLQRNAPSNATPQNSRIAVRLKSISPEKEIFETQYPFQGDRFREEIQIPTTGFLQLEVEVGSALFVFPLWVESGDLPPNTSMDCRFFAQRLSAQEALIFIQSGYPGNFLLSMNGAYSLPLTLSHSGFRVSRVSIPENVSSLTLFSSSSEPRFVLLPEIKNLTEKFSNQTKVCKFPNIDFHGLAVSPGWNRVLSSEVPWKSYLPYPKKNESFREKYQNSVLLESASLIDKGAYATAIEPLRQARIVLSQQASLEKLHLTALENLFKENQMQSFIDQKLTLSHLDQPFETLLQKISTQTGILFESNISQEKLRFVCQQRPLLEVLSQLSVERDLQIQIDFGSVSFQRKRSMLEFPVSTFFEETPFHSTPVKIGTLSSDLSFTPEFFIFAQPQTLAYGFVCKLLQ